MTETQWIAVFVLLVALCVMQQFYLWRLWRRLERLEDAHYKVVLLHNGQRALIMQTGLSEQEWERLTAQLRSAWEAGKL